MRVKDFPIVFLVLVPALLAMVGGGYHRVVFVYDGDTVLLENGEKVRYLGIDAPEIDHESHRSEFMAFSAREANRELVGSRCVSLEYNRERRDRYGRLLAYVYVEDGRMVNGELVSRGLAYVLTRRPDLRYRDFLLGQQRKAMVEKRGMWGRSLEGNEDYYLGSRRSYRFHRPECVFGKRISPQNMVRFNTPYDAFWAGYSPCNSCRP